LVGDLVRVPLRDGLGGEQVTMKHERSRAGDKRTAGTRPAVLQDLLDEG
jgi:hypothetical protein